VPQRFFPLSLRPGLKLTVRTGERHAIEVRTRPSNRWVGMAAALAAAHSTIVQASGPRGREPESWLTIGVCTTPTSAAIDSSAKPRSVQVVPTSPESSCSTPVDARRSLAAPPTQQAAAEAATPARQTQRQWQQDQPPTRPRSQRTRRSPGSGCLARCERCAARPSANEAVEHRVDHDTRLAAGSGVCGTENGERESACQCASTLCPSMPHGCCSRPTSTTVKTESRRSPVRQMEEMPVSRCVPGRPRYIRASPAGYSGPGRVAGCHGDATFHDHRGAESGFVRVVPVSGSTSDATWMLLKIHISICRYK
jgi:hypothetical protein